MEETGTMPLYFIKAGIPTTLSGVGGVLVSWQLGYRFTGGGRDSKRLGMEIMSPVLFQLVTAEVRWQWHKWERDPLVRFSLALPQRCLDWWYWTGS